MQDKLPTFSFMEELVRALAKKPKGGVELVGPWGSAKTLCAVQAAQARGAWLLLLTAGRLDAESAYDDLCTFAGEENTILFPAWEVLPTDTMAPADDIVAERMNALKRLVAARESGQTLFAVAPMRSILQRVVSPKVLQDDALELRVGREYPLNDLLEALIKLGYQREVMVEDRGEVSVRGGIVDIFPISSELPVRVEFFGDEVESIRVFEPETQRSVEKLEQVTILPRSEKGLLTRHSHEKLTLFTDYFPDDVLVCVDEPMAIAEELRQITGQIEDSPYYVAWEKVEKELRKRCAMSVAQVAHEKQKDALRILTPMQSLQGWAGQANDFWEQLAKWEAEQFTVQIYCVNSGERRRLYELCEEHGHRIGQGSFDLRIGLGRLRAGFASANEKIAVLSDHELYGRKHLRRKRRRFEAGQSITQFSDLKPGDYIVHEVHGLGRYLGLRRFEGKPGDFMALQYVGGDTLYVPVTHIDNVQKYVAGEGAVPKMDRIGGASWAKTKARVKKAVKDMTEELVKLYAAREGENGFAYSPDTPWQNEFEDAFEYEETPDQERAIVEIKKDMQSARPMDRLLCGDVGYGKTEVAMRMAFKAVQDGRQVCVLAPTTVLVQQHYTTFCERFADFPVTIEVLSRFRTDKEIKESLDRCKSGEADIAIGTHRLLSKDVNFKNLGLLIIDEEQRFGVSQKERIKHLRTQIDVLTLSATPIPRTLHMALLGARDMSVINTAPNDRLPIHTCIAVWDEGLIKEAIERELAREGQIFFLHNRVQTIEKIASDIQKLAPRARIGIGHGQMGHQALEDVMTAFIDKKIDVLVCTTIIGSGIDIPNANTIIVDRADTFGLSQLYQIRGRVGRYKHRAFAYLLIPGDKALTEEAQQRLKALEDFSSLGAGFRIAMRDLEIRGAGNLLGGEQSGHIAAVGFETYKDLIAETVAEVRGKAVRKRNLPPFDLNIDAFIPDDYVPTVQQKMTLYRRATNVQSLDEVNELAEEFKDRFGAPPRPVLRLLDVMRARALAGEAGAKGLAATTDLLRIEFKDSSILDEHMQHSLLAAFGKGLSFAWDSAPAVELAIGATDEAPKLAQALAQKILDILE